MAATSESFCKMRNGVGEEIPHLSNNKEKYTISQQPMKQRKLKMAATSESCRALLVVANERTCFN